MMIQKSYKFRIYPSEKQKILLNKTFGCIRYAWNQWVENFNNKTNIFKTPKQFKEELEWMKEVSSAAIQQKELDFKDFKYQFFNKKRKIKLGTPNFKSKYDKQSYRLDSKRFRIDGSRLRLEKIGFVKTVFDRVIPKDVKFINVTITKDIIGDFYVSILVEEETRFKLKTGKEIGVDVGIKSFVTLSDETIVENPKFFRKNQSKLKRIQRHLSRKIKGSNRYYKTNRRIARIYRKIERQRSFFLHNLSSKLVNDFDIIIIEDLNISGMIKNHNLSKSISDASWSEFFRQLEYKSKWYGKKLCKINRFEPTSKTCNICGCYNKDIDLNTRTWSCPCCGTTHDRDINAAKNILSVGINTELQTSREYKTSDIYGAIPNETSKNTILY
jgi:putative transposase